MKSSFSEIKSLVDQLAAKIDAPNDQLPTYGYSIDGGSAHIEIGEHGTVYYVAVERGIESLRWIPPNMNDLLYKIFDGAVWSMGSKYELKNRIKGQDSRRISFAESERLIGILSRDWQSRLHNYHEEILKKHPFDDHSRERVDYLLLLKSKGIGHEETWQLACEKYPLPV